MQMLELPNEILEQIGLYLLEPKSAAKVNKKREFRRTSRDFYNYAVTCKRLFLLYNEFHIVWRRIQTPSSSVKGLFWSSGTPYPPWRLLLLRSQMYCERCHRIVGIRSTVMEVFDIRVCRRCLKAVTVYGLDLQRLGILDTIEGKIASEWPLGSRNISIWTMRQERLYMWRDVVKLTRDVFKMPLGHYLEIRAQQDTETVQKTTQPST